MQMQYQPRDNKNRFSLLNKVTHFSHSKDKLKNSLALYTITTELNKIKNITKKNSNNLSFQLHPRDKIPNNINTITPIPISTNIFGNIPIPDTSKGRNGTIAGGSNYVSQQQHKNMLLSNSMKAISNNHNNNNANRTIEEATISTTINNSNSSHNYNHHLHTTSNKRAVSHSPNKQYDDYIHPKSSTVSSSLEKINMQKIKNELSKAKADLLKRDLLIKEQSEALSKAEKEKEISDANIKGVKMRYGKAKENIATLTVENKHLKEELGNTKLELKFLQEKEFRLMQVIYLIKERGINIDEVLADVSQMNHEIDGTERSSLSCNTVYFPDKIVMNNVVEAQEKGMIPSLDFGIIPSYRSDSDNEESSAGNILPQKVNMKFNKINFTSENLMDSNYFSGKKQYGCASEGNTKKNHKP